jgi:hypothetical protein
MATESTPPETAAATTPFKTGGALNDDNNFCCRILTFFIFTAMRNRGKNLDLSATAV